MKLSTRSRYGLRAMVDLARNADGATGRSIADSQNLPAAYLEQLMARLRNAQLVTSIRGAKGKFMLARNAKDITLAEIIEAMEGPIEIADCTDVPYCSSNPENCALRRIFSGANQVLQDYLDQVSLADLAKQLENKSDPIDYCI